MANTNKTSAQKAEEAQKRKAAEEESKRAQKDAEERAKADAERQANRAQAEAAKAKAQADAAEQAAKASAGKSAEPVKMLYCIAKKVPNCGFISDNGHRIPVTRIGQALKLPVGTAHAFPEFLEVGDEVVTEEKQDS